MNFSEKFIEETCVCAPSEILFDSLCTLWMVAERKKIISRDTFVRELAGAPNCRDFKRIKGRNVGEP